MSQQVVTAGPFRFCTKAKLDQIRLTFVESAPTGEAQLTGASINGQSFQFTAPDQQTYTREEFADHLAAAYCQLGITQYGSPSPRTSSARLC